MSTGPILLAQGAALDALLREAEGCQQAGQWQQAELLLRRVLDVAPDHVPALQSLAELASRFGHHQAAAELMARLEQVQSDLALSRDADYAEQPQSPWAAGDCLLEEIHGSGTVLVLFAGLGVGRSPPTFIFRKFLAPYAHIDKLFIRDLSLNWYLRGIPGIAADVDATARYLASRISGYRRTVFLGCSAGATAAILFGELLRVDKVIAFAPQAMLSDRKPAEMGDGRWEQRLAVLRRELGNSRHLDLVNFNPFRTAVDVYYHSGALLDCAHAQLLRGSSLTLQPQPGAGHLIALQMRDNGLLRPIIDREVSRQSSD